MNFWAYYASRTFINSIKKIFRSTFVIVVATIIIMGLMFGVGTAVIMNVAESQMGDSNYETESEYSSELVNGSEIEVVDASENGREDDAIDEDSTEIFSFDSEDLDEDIDVIMGVKLNKENGFKLFETVVELVLVLFIAWGLYNGTKNGSDIFLMSDVNFLFTAPLKPQSVLMFRLTFQMVASILASLYLVFQIPNWVMTMHLGVFSIVMIIVSWMLLLLISRLMSVFSYTIGATYGRVKNLILPIVVCFVAAFFLPGALLYMSNGKDLLAVMDKCYVADWTRWIPIIGWFKGMLICAVQNKTKESVIYAVVLIIGMVMMIYFIWKLKADFYEEALAGAQTRADQIETIKNNKKVAKNSSYKNKARKKTIKEGTIKGEGAKCFFTKEIYCRKRTAHFGIFSNMMIIHFSSMIAVTLLTEKLFETSNLHIAGFLALLIIFFVGLGNPIARETNRNWLFLVPEDPYKKVFYTMAAQSYMTILDVLPGIIGGMIITETNPLIALLWLVTIVSFDFMLSGTGVMLEAFFPSTAMELVKAFIQMVIKMFLFMVLAVGISVGIMMGGIYVGIGFVMSLSIAIGTIIFIIYPSMLHKGI